MTGVTGESKKSNQWISTFLGLVGVVLVIVLLNVFGCETGEKAISDRTTKAPAGTNVSKPIAATQP